MGASSGALGGSVLITYRRHYRAGNFSCKTKERGKRESGGEERVGRVIVNSRAGSDGYRSVG